MKYNRSEIMKRAWELYRTFRRWGDSFGKCLTMAWKEAKQEAADNAYNGVEFANGMEITMNDVTCTLNRWTKCGMDRVYINRNGKRDGYVDLVSRKNFGGSNAEYHEKIVAAILTMRF